MGGAGLFGYRLGPSASRQQIVGLKEVQYNLAKLGSDAKNDMKPAHKKAAELVVAEAKPIAPMISGALKESLRPFARQRAGVIRAGSKSVPYAGPIIFGWPARAIKANPFIFDALDHRRADIIKAYEDRMEEVIAKHSLGIGPPHHLPTAMLSAVL